MSTRVAPIWAVCIAAAVVAKVCVDGVVAQPFCESEKRKLASELKEAPTQEPVHSKNDDMVE